MGLRTFVGSLGGGASPDALAAALGDGARSLQAGPLALATTGPPSSAGCLLDGTVDTLGAVATAAGLDPQQGPEPLLAQAWARLGDALAGHLRGAFAAVLWNPTGRLLLVRDPMGERGLVWARSGGALLFASEVAELLDVLPARPGPEPIAMAHWLGVSGMPGDLTLFDGVRRVEPGHALTVAPGGAVRSWRHWQPRYAPPERIRMPEAAGRVREAIAAAVARQSRGRRETAMLLSGGLDSTAVATVAAADAPAAAPRRAYSAVFPGRPQVDEARLIDLAAAAAGLETTRAVVRGGSVLAGALPYLERWALPPVSPNLFFWLPLLRRAAADGTTVLLDGQGGDELFALSPFLLADRLRAGRALGAVRLMGRVPGAHHRPPWGAVREWMWRYALRGALPAGMHEALRRRRAGRHSADHLRPEVARALLETEEPHAWKRLPGPRWWAATLDASAHGMGPQLAYDHQRRREALAGLQARHPLADADLVELVLSLPPELAFHPRHTRPVLREAVAGLLPDPVRLRRGKSSFDVVFHDALAGPDLAALRALLGAPDAEVRAYARPRALAALAEGPPAEAQARQLWAIRAWRLATAELWLRGLSDPGAPGRLARELGLAPADVEIVAP